MLPEKNISEPSFRRANAKKVILWILALICIAILIPLFAIPAYLSSETGKNMILKRINSSIDGVVKLDSLSVGWLKGLSANGFSFKDNSGNTEITARQITAKPRYLALLAGEVSISRADIDQPRVSIILPPRRKTAEPNLSANPTTRVSPKSPAVGAFPIENMNLKISNGRFRVETAGPQRLRKTLEFKDINSRLAIRPLGQQSSFNVSMALADANDAGNTSKISAAGLVKTSSKKWSLAKTSGNLRIDVNQLDLSRLSPLFTLLNVDVNASGKISADIDAKLNNGLFENVNARINASDLDISGPALKGDHIQSSVLKAETEFSTDAKSVNIDNLDIKTDWLNAKLHGSIPTSLRSVDDFLQASSPDTLSGQFDCDLAKALGQFRNMAGFKKDFNITYGRLSGDIKTAALAGERTISGKVKLWALEGTFPVKHVILSRPIEVQAKIVSRGKQVNIEQLKMDSSFADVECSGSLDDMSYSGKIDFAKAQYDIGQFFDFKNKLTGQANLTGTGSWKNEILSSKGRAVLNSVTLRTPQGKTLSEPSADIQYDFRLNADSRILTVNSLNAKASPGDIMVSDFVLPLRKGTPQAMNINMLASVDLAGVMKWARVFDAVNTNLQLTGLAKGDLAINKNGDVFRVVTKNTVINNFSLSYPGQKPFSQPRISVAFDGLFDTANKIYDIRTLNVAGPQIKISGRLTNNQTGKTISTHGVLKADYELAAVNTIIAPYLPRGLRVSGKREDTFQFSSVYPKNDPSQFMENLNAETSFGFDKADYMGILLGKTELHAKITNGVLSIAPFSTTANNGILSFGANADLTKTPKIMKTPQPVKMLSGIQINSETSDKLLSYVNPLFANAVNVTGTLNFDCEKMAIPLESGYQKDLAVTGTLSLNNVRLGASTLLAQIIQLTGSRSDPVITIKPTRFVLVNDVLSYDNMGMDIDGKPVNFSGFVRLDKTMRMNITLPWKLSGARITLPLRGTVNKPKIDTGKLIENQVQQELQKQIQKGLERIFK